MPSFEANRFALRNAGGSDRPGLQEPKLAVGPSPFDVARRIVKRLDLSSQFRQRDQLRIAQTELVLTFHRDFRFTCGKPFDFFVAEMAFDNLAGGAFDDKAIRRDAAGNHGLAQAPRGLDNHALGIRLQRVTREQHTRDFGRHEPLHDHRHGHFTNTLALAVDFRALRLQRGPTLQDRGAN